MNIITKISLLTRVARPLQLSQVPVGVRKNVHTTASLQLFWEKDKYGGYNPKLPMPNRKELIRTGLKELKNEIKIWQQEVIEKFEDDPIILYRYGEIDKVWEFNGQDSLKNWVATSDSDNAQGYSKCDFTISPANKGLFSGTLDTRPPKDGKIKKAGYCNIKSTRPKKSFKRETYYDWSPYTHLVLRIRGDGRTYMLTIGTPGFFDVTWHDTFHYVLHTRGGPYWQLVKIPFSKFFYAAKGRIQDRQSAIPLSLVASLGITTADSINGPFRLEIDYIGLENSPTHTETFAYEMYKAEKYTVSV